MNKIIKLRCINCGKEFEQEVKVESEDKFEKEIAWYKKNQKQQIEDAKALLVAVNEYLSEIE